MVMAFDAGAYQKERRAVGSEYAANRAANSYAQQLSQIRGQRQIGDLRDSYQRSTPGFIAGYGRRGLAGPGVQSGVYQGALQRYAADQFRRVQDVQDGMQDAWNQGDQANKVLEAQKQRALGELERKQRLEIAQAAAQLAQFNRYR
jgi:hypothetical protein